MQGQLKQLVYSEPSCAGSLFLATIVTLLVFAPTYVGSFALCIYIMSYYASNLLLLYKNYSTFFTGFLLHHKSHMNMKIVNIECTDTLCETTDLCVESFGLYR